MRLVCPNCAAKYEVDDSAIPEEGRSVQCANCGDTWFQESNSALEAASTTSDSDFEPEPEQETDPQDDMPAPVAKGADQSVLDILRNEAELDAEARKTPDAPDSNPQDDFEPPIAAAPRIERPKATQRRNRKSRLNFEAEADGAAEEAEINAAPKRELSEPAREQLPNVDELNSTLRSANDKRRKPKGKKKVNQAERESGRLGLYLAVLIALMLLSAYMLDDQIAEAVPEARPYLDNYVAMINSARRWFENLAGTVVDAAKNLLEQYG